MLNNIAGFLNPATLPRTCDYLVIAGGGAGSGQSGGGGAGGYRTGSSYSMPATFTVTIGGGGTGNTGGSKGTSGSNSVFDTITSSGGGAGASESVEDLAVVVDFNLVQLREPRVMLDLSLP